MPKFGECPLPNPPPQGRERVAADFAISGNLKHSLGLQPLISGRLKSKKAANTTCFLAEPLIPTATPSSLPWERVRERATSRTACIWTVEMLGKVAAIWRMPSPQPSPTGEGAGCSRFKYYRSTEKECPKYQQQEFFRQPLSQGRWNKRRERFFRRPLNPSVACVPQGTHAVGWGCRENGERVRAYSTHPTCGLRLAENMLCCR